VLVVLSIEAIDGVLVAGMILPFFSSVADGPFARISSSKTKIVEKLVEMLKGGVGTKTSSNQSRSSSFAIVSGTVAYCHSSGKGQPI